MADLTIAVPPKLPVGTSLSVYPDPEGDIPPSGPVTSTSVVASNSTAVLTGLTPGVPYQAGAFSGGKWVGVLVQAPHIQPAAGHVLEDEGVLLSNRPGLSFVGDAVTVSDDPGNERSVVAVHAAPVLNVKDAPFNAKGDGDGNGGGTDDSAAINAAIAAASAAATHNTRVRVELGSSTYRLGSTLTLLSNVELHGNGAVLDASTTTPVSGKRKAITATGSVAASVLLATDANKGSYSFDVASVAGLSVGDWVVVATQGVNYYPYAGGVNSDRGEIKRILSIAGSTLTFEQGLYDTYTVANAAFIRKITFVENVVLDGIRFAGSNTANDQNRAIEFSYVNGFRIDNCEIQNFDVYALYLSMSIRGTVDELRIRGVYYDGITGVDFYAVACYDATQWVTFSNIIAERVRHVWLSSSQSTSGTAWGAPRFVTGDNLIGQNMQGGGAGRSWAFEHHGFGDGIVLSNLIADGCYGGLVVRGPGIKVSNLKVSNWYQYALQVASDVVNATDIQIEHVTVKQRSIEGGGAATPVAVYVDLTNATAVDLVLRSIDIEHDKATAPCVQALGAVDGKGLIFRDVKVRCVVTPSTWPVQITPQNVLLEAIKLYATSYGIRSLGANNTIKDCFMWGVGSGTGDFIFSDQTGQVIENNVGRACNFGVRLAAGANNATVANNVMDSNSDVNAYNIASTLTGLITRNNTRPSTANAVASAATITVPICQEAVSVSGTTPITTINTAGHDGRRITLRFPNGTGAITMLTDGGTFFLAGNFAPTANGTITLHCEGTNWFEDARSAN